MGREATFVRRTPLVYERVGDSIRDRIERGRLAPGDRLPPIRTLSREFGCNYHTVRRALEVLEREGLVERVPGSGTFVRVPSRPAGGAGTFDKLSARVLSASKGAGASAHTRKGRRRARTSVCALMPDVRNLYLGRLIRELQEQADIEEVDLTFDVLPGIDVAQIRDRYPASPGFDAAILPWFRERDGPEVRKLLRHFEVPVVTHLPVPGYEGCCFKTPGALGKGSRRAARMACDYFRALGFAHVALLGPSRTEDFEFQNRLAEYTKAMHEADMEVRVFLAGPRPDHYQRIVKCGRDLGRPLGVVAYYDELAIRLLNVLNRERLDVPGRVAVLGFNNSQGCETTLPPLSSMECPFEFIAGGMLRHARALAAGKSEQVDAVEPIRFVIRESCGGRALPRRRLDAILRKLRSRGRTRQRPTLVGRKAPGGG